MKDDKEFPDEGEETTPTAPGLPATTRTESEADLDLIRGQISELGHQNTLLERRLTALENSVTPAVKKLFYYLSAWVGDLEEKLRGSKPPATKPKTPKED